MTTKSGATLWGIHAGRTGDADDLFLQHGLIALGWPQMGNLKSLAQSREDFKKKYAQIFAAAAKNKPGTVPTSAGQLFRFANEMAVGDFVVYPSKHTKTVHIGKIASDYFHDETIEPHYPQRRKVVWLKSVPRTHLSQGALYEIGSALSVFVVKNYADEFWHLLESDKASVAVAPTQDESVAEVSQDVAETTADFILKVLGQETKGHPFAHFVGALLQTMGFKTRVSAEGPDGGIDIVAHKDELGFEPPIVKVQCKSTEASVGDPVISQLYGKVAPNEFGLFVTLGYFTPQAMQFARSKTNLRLIDGDALVQLVLEHYEDLDTKYKALIPLRRATFPFLRLIPIELGIRVKRRRTRSHSALPKRIYVGSHT
jgi:restriction system protein